MFRVELHVPEPGIDMFLLQRYMRGSSNRRMSDILELTDVRDMAELIPRFGRAMPVDWDCNNSLELCRNFYLNNFADKDTFHAILTYQ